MQFKDKPDSELHYPFNVFSLMIDRKRVGPIYEGRLNFAIIRTTVIVIVIRAKAKKCMKW
jgi:hypothetical protein